jgi:hypothetical protein
VHVFLTPNSEIEEADEYVGVATIRQEMKEERRKLDKTNVITSEET